MGYAFAAGHLKELRSKMAVALPARSPQTA